MPKRGVPLAILAVLLLNEAVDSFAQFCFKKTSLAAGTPVIASLPAAGAFLSGVLGQGYLWLGVAAVALVFVSWTVVLSKVDLSAAMPVTSLSYLMVALIAVLFLHERIPVLEWCGIFLIMVGVAIVSWEPGEKKGPAP
jgi:drug/metabolite transporter (DMT)-like permease